MHEGLASGLRRLLDLEQVEDDIYRTTADHMAGAADRVFGGQVAAQALMAAGRTVEQRLVHSLHSYFLRPGDLASPIVFVVDRIRSGRSFTTRRVVAVQHGEAIFNLQCSFHAGEPGLEHHDSAPAVPAAEDLPATALRPPGSKALVSSRADSGVEIRFVTAPPWTRTVPGNVQRLWLRASEPLGEDYLVHAAAIAYASDLTLLDAATARHGRSSAEDSFAGASLDHCMWFHRPTRADDWLLYDQHSPSAHDGRGLSIGSLYDRRGELAVTVVQEGLLRFRGGGGAGTRP